MKTIAERFKEALATYVATTYPNAGHAVNEQGARHAIDMLLDAKDSGASFLVGGPDMVGPSSVKPTIVTQVPEKARIRDEESFGPSATLYTVSSEKEAIDLANSTKSGLTASVHSTNLPRALKVAKELEFGQVHINSITEYEEGKNMKWALLRDVS
jgi:acyl-CoA reductase-like NAD-dependent aldehyde dehydrogenase